MTLGSVAGWAMFCLWQVVVYERPASPWRRGLVALPPGVTSLAVVASLVALLLWAHRRRR